ncbi:MAG: hypothetical protein KY453_08495 [Gemmatimonadetes bacterium]|nr:hypothetical protein [Gemmatimonadota bacterium]
MARLPGRSQEHPLTSFAAAAGSLAALTAVGLLCAADACAQPAPGAETRLVAVAGARLGPLAGRTSVLPGGALLLRLTPRVALGGGGWASRSPVELDRSGTALSFGYGGVVLRVTRTRRAPVFFGWQLLLGAGSAVIRDTAVGVELDADNVIVAEPAVAAHVPLLDRVDLSASAGWRFTGGVDRAAGLDASDLGGWMLGLSLALAFL